MIKHAQHAAVETARMPNPAGDGDDAHIAPAPRVSVQAFCETVETAAAVQAAGSSCPVITSRARVVPGGARDTGMPHRRNGLCSRAESE